MTPAEESLSRRRIRLEGVVQGVGFRPFVCTLARRLGLAGEVWNDARGVVVEAEGEPTTLAEFADLLLRTAPPLAVVERLAVEDVPVIGAAGFSIAASRAGEESWASVSPDIATCEACLREILDPRDRRYQYPFANCSDCGPRFTIVRDVPYDRARTTMSAFVMCGDCAREYHDPADRRFHAQPISCPACGPRLRLVDRSGVERPGDPLRGAAELLRGGCIVAVKGLGGYHLAATAANEAAVAALRARKQREERPFALMVPGMEEARDLAEIGPLEERLLTSPRRPIVVVRRRQGAPVAAAVAPANRFLGLMLPYTPLHHLLCRHFGGAFVLTSGNVSDEPIAFADDDAVRRLSRIADFFLVHDRPIHTRTDDSVVRVVGGREMPIRRSRGYAPQPLLLPWSVDRPVLACGAELKSTFCLAKGSHAFVSPHIGDLENLATWHAFTEGIEHFQRLFDVRPRVVAHDLHPEYLSTKYALEFEGVVRVAVQHHHAHVAACLAENGEEGPAIGVAFDGLGYGTDGTFWGGEFLLADLGGFERLAHLEPVPIPGGTAAIKEPWRMAAVYLRAAYGDAIPAHLAVARRNRERWSRVLQVAAAGVNSPKTSSAGRLFDAVAAALDVRDVVSFEGQAAIELEQLADLSENGAYAAGFDAEEPQRLRGADLFRAAVEDLGAGTAPAIVAARFHNGLARAIVAVCDAIRERRGTAIVALSGGVFQNAFLLERAAEGLEQAGFRVLTHARVPPNDGGISFGQAVVAAARQAGWRAG